ncbi:MAG: hypothetical protein HYY14_01920 [Candidatus Omnitrophica bacterium]|nr:hypothetical protein [Candidatus Omnitrophota bacterium]
MKKESGLTFLEILMTIVVLTVALIPIMQIAPFGVRNARNIERLTHCVFLAQVKVDEIRNRAIDSYTNGGAGYDESATAFSSPYATYKYTVADNEAADIKNITVTVWYDEDGDGTVDSYSEAWREDEASVVLDTRVADRG